MALYRSSPLTTILKRKIDELILDMRRIKVLRLGVHYQNSRMEKIGFLAHSKVMLFVPMGNKVGFYTNGPCILGTFFRHILMFVNRLHLLKSPKG